MEILKILSTKSIQSIVQAHLCAAIAWTLNDAAMQMRVGHLWVGADRCFTHLDNLFQEVTSRLELRFGGRQMLELCRQGLYLVRLLLCLCLSIHQNTVLGLPHSCQCQSERMTSVSFKDREH